MRKLTTLLAAVLLLFAPVVDAQLLSSTNIAVTVTVSSVNTVTLSVSGGPLTFDSTTGATGNVTFNTTYNLDGTASNITLYTWFSTPSAALSTTGGGITSSSISATFTPVNGNFGSSGSGQPCNQSPAVSGVTPGGACQGALLINQSQNGGAITNSGGGGLGTTYSLSIVGYSGLGGGSTLHLTAGSYTGTLNAMAWAA